MTAHRMCGDWGDSFAFVLDLRKPPEWLEGPASAVLEDLQGTQPIAGIAVFAAPIDHLNGLTLGIVEGLTPDEPLSQLDDDLDPDDHTDYGGGNWVPRCLTGPELLVLVADILQEDLAETFTGWGRHVLRVLIIHIRRVPAFAMAKRGGSASETMSCCIALDEARYLHGGFLHRVGGRRKAGERRNVGGRADVWAEQNAGGPPLRSPSSVCPTDRSPDAIGAAEGVALKFCAQRVGASHIPLRIERRQVARGWHPRTCQCRASVLIARRRCDASRRILTAACLASRSGAVCASAGRLWTLAPLAQRRTGNWAHTATNLPPRCLDGGDRWSGCWRGRLRGRCGAIVWWVWPWALGRNERCDHAVQMDWADCPLRGDAVQEREVRPKRALAYGPGSRASPGRCAPPRQPTPSARWPQRVSGREGPADAEDGRRLPLCPQGAASRRRAT